jgi:hypothetical protein
MNNIVRLNDKDTSPLVSWEPIVTAVLGVLTVCVSTVFYI